MLGFGPLGTQPLGTAGTPLPLWFAANFAGHLKEQAKYYAAFGRFISSYALAEAGFHMAARVFSGLPEDWARIIFGQMRASDVIGRLRKLIAGSQNSEGVEGLISQFNFIGEQRDHFVHRAIGYDVSGALTVTSLLSDDPVRKFTIPELEAMDIDCRAIFSRMMRICNRTDYLKFVGSDVTLLDLEHRTLK